MDFINKAVGGGNNSEGQSQPQEQKSQESGGFMDKLNGLAGGGQSSEHKEDGLDKAVDFVQEKLGGGDQSNESAIEQAKDEQISDFIRGKYKDSTGKEFFVADKEH